jgi:hypothetical protein
MRRNLNESNQLRNALIRGVRSASDDSDADCPYEEVTDNPARSSPGDIRCVFLEIMKPPVWALTESMAAAAIRALSAA